MPRVGNFYWEKRTEPDTGCPIYVLGYKSEAAFPGRMEFWIAPDAGSNLLCFSVDGERVIGYETGVLREKGFTGMPILYPTPNQLRNAQFVYKSRKYLLEKNGKPVYDHGLVYNEAWEHHEPVPYPESVSMRTWIDFAKGNGLYAAFPFEHRLELVFALTATGIRIDYSIQNRDDREIPFGFGLHPYFMKLAGDTDTLIRLPVCCVMEHTADLFPTGRLIPVENTEFDLRHPTSIGHLDMDHVFLRAEEAGSAEIIYKSKGMKVTMEASPDFSHLVLYSPAGREFFCIEHQTCSTDAHNLYDSGFVKESGLKFVVPGECHSGHVEYKVRGG